MTVRKNKERSHNCKVPIPTSTPEFSTANNISPALNHQFRLNLLSLAAVLVHYDDECAFGPDDKQTTVSLPQQTLICCMLPAYIFCGSKTCQCRQERCADRVSLTTSTPNCSAANTSRTKPSISKSTSQVLPQSKYIKAIGIVLDPDSKADTCKVSGLSPTQQTLIYCMLTAYI